MDSSGDDFFDSPREQAADVGCHDKEGGISSKYSNEGQAVNKRELSLSDNDRVKGYNNNNISALHYEDVPSPNARGHNVHHRSYDRHFNNSNDNSSESSRSSGSSKHRSTHAKAFPHKPRGDNLYSDESDDEFYDRQSSKVESPAIKVDVNVPEQQHSYDEEYDQPKSRRYIMKDKSKERKPPLPSSKRRTSRKLQKDSVPEDESMGLLEPGSTYYTSDGRKMRRGQCSYSDREVSDSNSSSEEELRCRRKSPGREELKLGLGSLASPRSRSRSNSSEWSTGSESYRRREGDEVDRPRTRLSRRSSSSESERRRRGSSSSNSSITVSSLSDTEAPDSRSQDIFPESRDRRGDSADKDRMNLEILLSALLDADAERPPRKNVSISVPNGQQDRSSPSKPNYTYSRDRMRTIDSENQRLLNSIMAQRTNQAQQSKSSTSQDSKGKSRRRRVSPPRRVTNATVNRQREQQRIERENLALLKRLNKIKPSADISRDQHLEDYRRQMSYHCPDLRDSEYQLNPPRSKSSLSATGGRRPASASYNRSSYGDSTRSTRPTSAITRPISASSRPISASSRPISASSRPISASSRRPTSAGRGTSIRKKPEWQTGW